MSHHIVETKHLSYDYPDGTPALHDISLRITHGESVAVIGRNGSGKSTLLLHLNGCILPRSGEVRIGDTPITARTITDIRRTVGVVFQDPDDQLFMPTVGEDVAFGPTNMGLDEDEVRRRTNEALRTVNMEGLAERPPYRLSGGEKRAVSIAVVIAMSPSILVMDEPSSSLDAVSRRCLITLLKGFEHTKIIATHDLDMAAELCDRILVLRKGELFADGSTAEIFRNRQLLEQAGLEPPLSMGACALCSGTRTTA